MEYGRMYKDRIVAAGQNLSLFTSAVERCDIPSMLDNSSAFLETFKNANGFYNSLPRQNQISLKISFDKSRHLMAKYFEVKSRIGKFCECKSPQ